MATRGRHYYEYMSASIIHRLFPGGKMPDTVRGTLGTERVTFFGEGLWVSARGSYRVPGRAQAAGVRMHRGAFAVTPSRIVATIGRAKIIDAPFSADTADAAATLTLTPDGLHFAIDVGRSTPNGEGHAEIHFKTTVADEILRLVPQASLSVSPNANGVEQLLRWV
ncbi:hypothetical protein BH09ACT6_BH09ACT6_22110 [soil metagenome]